MWNIQTPAEEMHGLVSKPSQSLLTLNSQVLGLNQYQRETTFIARHSASYSSVGAL